VTCNFTFNHFINEMLPVVCFPRDCVFLSSFLSRREWLQFRVWSFLGGVELMQISFARSAGDLSFLVRSSAKLKRGS